MEEKSRYSLQRTMLVYFLLIACASLFVGIEFIADTNSAQLRQELTDNFDRYANNMIAAEAVFLPIEKIRNKAVLMVVIIMVVMAIVLTMFTRNITEPLQQMIETAKRISTGDLRETVAIQARNELAELGAVINELASNLQEATLLSKNVCRIGSESISSILAVLGRDDLGPEEKEGIRGELDRLNTEMGSLAGLVDCFRFYTGDHDG